MKAGELIGGKYLLEHLIGEGSMGEVWAAVNTMTCGKVALKLISDPSPDLRVRLFREARAYGSLTDPNIVRIYDVDKTEGGEPFLVMELLTGETLAKHLRRHGRLPPARAVAIAGAIARALRAAHAKGILHRDLKPDNVYLHRQADVAAEVVKVLDFGLSKHLGAEDAVNTATGTLLGSPAYMSPEQARADKNVDHRSDLWSLGVVTFEMLTGRRPFTAKSPYAVIADIMSSDIPTVSSLVPEVGPGLSAVVARCLTRSVGERCSSAEEILAALVPFTDELTATGERPRPMTGSAAEIPDADDAAATCLLPRVALRSAPQGGGEEAAATAILGPDQQGPMRPAVSAAPDASAAGTLDFKRTQPLVAPAQKPVPLSELKRTLRMIAPPPRPAEPEDEDALRTAPLVRPPLPSLPTVVPASPLFHAPPVPAAPGARASPRLLLVAVGCVVAALLALALMLGRRSVAAPPDAEPLPRDAESR